MFTQFKTVYKPKISPTSSIIIYEEVTFNVDYGDFKKGDYYKSVCFHPIEGILFARNGEGSLKLARVTYD